MKLKKKTISKILIIISSLVALTLLIFVVLSINFLAPVDKKSEEVIEFNVPTGMGKNQIADELEKAGLIKNALFFNILKFAWGLCLDRSRDTILMVDEAHVLLAGKNVLGADFLANVQRRSRKYNTGTIIITQQPTDFSDPDVIVQGKAIFDNASYYMIMGLKKQAVEDLSLLIDLNDNEKESIKGYSQGEALFVCGSRRMRITVILTQEELDSFGSGGGL